jgi:hypothetical protein
MSALANGQNSVRLPRNTRALQVGFEDRPELATSFL